MSTPPPTMWPCAGCGREVQQSDMARDPKEFRVWHRRCLEQHIRAQREAAKTKR